MARYGMYDDMTEIESGRVVRVACLEGGEGT